MLNKTVLYCFKFLRVSINFRLCITVIYLVSLFFIQGFAQTPNSVNQPLPDSEKGLFDVDSVLQITLKGNIRELLNNRSDDPKKFPLVLSYKQQDKNEIAMPVEISTRGHFRRLKENCSYPPLSIVFPESAPHLSTVFKEQKKIKLVMPCRGDEYVIREWLVYKLYNLVTPKSFRARLIKVSMEDIRNKKSITPFYGILLEEEKQMAKRNQFITCSRKLRPEQTQRDAFVNMAIFEYLIGNTDWSIEFLQNIKLMAKDSNAIAIPVPYDFDHAGLVDAPYAKPFEELELSSLRERRYRGYCLPDLRVFETSISLYNSLKKDIYKLYTDCTLLDAKYVRSTTQYLDAFYATINNPKAWQRDFAYPCNKSGTGNVIIKGLK